MSASLLKKIGKPLAAKMEPDLNRSRANATTFPTIEKTLVRGSAVTGKEPASNPSRVMVVDHNPATRRKFRNILRSTNDFELTRDFANANEALNVVPRSPPDLMLLGICRGRDRSGIKCISLFKRLVVGLRIIIVLGAGDTDLVEPGLRSGADGCLVKPVNAAQCVATLTVAARGWAETALDARRLEPNFFNEANSGNHGPLSGREQEVMSKLAEGLLYKEIACELQMSEALVRKHAHKIYRKFQVQNRAEAIGVWSALFQSSRGASMGPFA